MLFLDDFLEMLEELPAEFRERFNEMRKLDHEVETGLDQTKKSINEFFEGGAHLTDEEKQRRQAYFNQLFNRYRSLSAEKISMAERMKEILEKYLQHLDKEKTHFKYELEADNPGITEVIEKRFNDYCESVIAARKERKRRHPSENGAAFVDNSLKLSKFSFDSLPSFGTSLDFPSMAEDDLLSPSLVPMISSPLPMTPPNGISKGRKSTALDSPLIKKRPSIPSLKSTLSVPASLNGAALSPAVSEKSWSSVLNDSSSPNSTITVNPLLSATTMPNFVGSESRHGRPRKLTSRVQEMFSEAVSRQRRHHPATIHHPEEDDQDRSEGEDSDDAHKSWCFCGEASYGEMVCCDNEHCTIQWFHYSCIGMETTPKGKWYCPRCVSNNYIPPAPPMDPTTSF